MFTGIIQKIGTIKKISANGENSVIEITASTILNGQKKGDSISINGICSTITGLSKTAFTVEFMPETLKKTTASKWKEEEKVNLEPALKVGDNMSGHFVSGHVDTTGKIRTINDNEIDILYPRELAKFLALKGSVTVDGISLTISKLEENFFTVSLIPHTLENTTIGIKKEGDLVNIEIDIIARYLKRLFDARDKQTNYEFLKERGFI
jgi:riboflavin synthase